MEGVLIDIQSGIKCKPIDVPKITGIVHVFIKNIIKSIKVLVICVCVPPSVCRDICYKRC